ncbi:MAG: peptide-methionine (S)-S-oxide reductase MsrA [Patescibacteria group bacterium]
MEKIIFGGGCFWCVEAVFQRLRGVISVTNGYAGGDTDHPSYHDVSRERTGHAEVVQVVFDPVQIPLSVLLDVFFSTHDPTTLNRQGHDAGTQYRSAIYYTGEDQKQAIGAYIKKLKEEEIFDRPIVTEVRPIAAFYPAEDYHQNYYNRNADASYCQFVIEPKLAKLRQRFSAFLT